MPPNANRKHVNTFRRRLLAWFRRHGRDLPWRRTRDPYAIVVSEFMLQQTQVSRVLEFYPRFLRRYPTLHHLARARPAAVREAWNGLGYYRRAENLRRLAQAVVKEHRGRIPEDIAVLQLLPGVGAYTAGAVACFAYERPAATVDTNVARVLQRVFAGARRRVAPAALRALHLDVQPRRGPNVWAFNQAVMELGALVCTARTPRCGICPARTGCRAYSVLSEAKRTVMRMKVPAMDDTRARRERTRSARGSR